MESQSTAEVSRDLKSSKFSFHWELLDTILHGKSLLDSKMGLSGFPLETQEDAHRFLRSYGYDLERPVERAEVHGNLHEAVHFVRRYFLQPDNPEGLKIEIPRRILEMVDVSELLLLASGEAGNVSSREVAVLQAWACSLLKVIHTIAHLDKDIRSPYFPEIQKQIFDRFYRVLHRDEKNQLYLGLTGANPAQRVDLVAFETKPKKPRDSILIKLLHKRENVAEDIFDRVGMRLITKDKLDALRAVKFLKDQMIIMPANNKPSRARNSLIPLEEFRAEVERFMSERKIVGEPTLEEELALRKNLEAIEFDTKAQPTENRHTSAEYKAIQFTSRQLIKLTNPVYDQIKALKSLVQGDTDQRLEAIQQKMEAIDLRFISREVRFFYPFEVQILDQQSALQNEQGTSAHKEYRKAQIQTAMKRVMAGLIALDGSMPGSWPA